MGRDLLVVLYVKYGLNSGIGKSRVCNGLRGKPFQGDGGGHFGRSYAGLKEGSPYFRQV